MSLRRLVWVMMAVGAMGACAAGGGGAGGGGAGGKNPVGPGGGGGSGTTTLQSCATVNWTTAFAAYTETVTMFSARETDGKLYLYGYGRNTDGTWTQAVAVGVCDVNHLTSLLTNRASWEA